MLLSSLRIPLLMIALAATLLSVALFYPSECMIDAAGTPDVVDDIVAFPGSSDSASLTVELAETPQEQATGLMNREELAQWSGMLFIFDGDSRRSFWMKNTLIPLDMIFVNSSLDIVSIQNDVPPCETPSCPTYVSGLPAMYVVEANAGFAESHNIEPGQKIDIIRAS